MKDDGRTLNCFLLIFLDSNDKMCSVFIHLPSILSSMDLDPSRDLLIVPLVLCIRTRMLGDKVTCERHFATAENWFHGTITVGFLGAFGGRRVSHLLGFGCFA